MTQRLMAIMAAATLFTAAHADEAAVRAPEAAAKSLAVWCAPDRAKAWDEAMRTGAVPRHRRLREAAPDQQHAHDDSCGWASPGRCGSASTT